MQKTTAKIEYRDYVPWGRYAIPFCQVSFYGFRAKEMQKKWKDITHEKYLKNYLLYKENEKRIQQLRDQAESIYRSVKEAKPFFRFWYNKKEKDLRCEAKKLLSQACELEEENEVVDKEKFFGVPEGYRKIEELLKGNGFVLTEKSSKEDAFGTKIEVWTLEE